MSETKQTMTWGPEGFDHLKALRAEIQGRLGPLPPTPGLVLAQLALHVTCGAAGFAVAVLAEPFWLRALGMLVSSLGSLGIGTNTHTSSHYSTSSNRRVNEVLTLVGYPFWLGMAATYWWNKHLVVHHPTPNVIGVDDDADLMPFFAFTRQQLEGSRGWRRFYFRVQGWLFPLALIGNGFNVQLLGWRYLIAHLRDPRKRQILHWLDLGTLGLHYAFWIGVPLLVLPLGEVLWLYFARLALMGFALFGAFAPAHFPQEAAAFEKGEEPADFFYLQTAGTVNFHSNAYGRLLCSGVDYQIEHHLFPHVSHLHYPKLAPLVADYCRRHGYPYQTLGWGKATWKCFTNMNSPKVMKRSTQPPEGSIARPGSVPPASPVAAEAQAPS